jgi:hypothetical protein
MAAHPITIYLPEEVYESYQKTADTRNLTLEEVITEALRENYWMSEKLDVLLKKMASFTDRELWAATEWRLHPEQENQRFGLVQKGKQGNLTPLEAKELEELLNLTGKYMVLRSEAVVLLQERGYDVSHFVNARVHDLA